MRGGKNRTTTNLNIRLHEDLKKEFNLLCDDLGMRM